MKKSSLIGVQISTLIILIVVSICSLVSNSKAKNKISTELTECQSNNKIMSDSINSLHEDIDLLNQANDELVNENQIFTSMLSEIEHTRGGHEILKELWEKMGYDEE